LIGTAGALALALGACGGGDSEESSANVSGGGDAAAAGEASAAKVDPCSLVTNAEVAEAIGEEVVAAKADGASCTYETADAQASSVTVEVKQGGAEAEMDVQRKTAELLSGMGKAVAKQGGAGEDVNQMLQASGDQPKIGDDALFGPNQMLSVRKGDTYIAVQPPMMRSRMSGGNPLLSKDDKRKMAVAIAEKAVGRVK
jgi:hypothetical protein